MTTTSGRAPQHAPVPATTPSSPLARSAAQATPSSSSAGPHGAAPAPAPAAPGTTQTNGGGSGGAGGASSTRTTANATALAAAPRQPPRNRALVLAGLAAAVALGLVLWSVRVLDAETDQHRRSARCIAEMQLSLTLAHQRFEEAITGDKSIDVAGEVYEEIDESHRIARALLNGGDTPYGRVEPLRTEATMLARIADRIQAWRRLHELRWSERSATQPGSEADQAYDSAFEQILKLSTQLDASIHHNIESAQDRMLLVHAVLVAVFAVIVLWGVRSIFEGNRRDKERAILLEERVAERTRELSAVIVERERAQVDLKKSNDELKSWVQAIEQRSREISLLGELAQLLPASSSAADAFQVCARFCERIFPGAAGYVAMLSNARDVVEPAGAWGDPPLKAEPFAPDACWALRRGRAHAMADAGAVKCPHLTGEEEACVCVPMIAQGETLGVMHLRLASDGADADDQTRLAVTVTEHVALSIANLRLRETLRTHSMRDALTGLFNKRFMEEALDREVRAATRKKRNIGLIMLDLDNFKRVNDDVGHEAGDVVLREVAGFVRSSLRTEDIACHTGSDEMLLMLSDSSVADTAKRAEQICAGLRTLSLRHNGAQLPKVTASFGVVGFPHHGATPEALTRAADAALYQAKQAGRDQVVTAQSTLPPTVPPAPA